MGVQSTQGDVVYKWLILLYFLIDVDLVGDGQNSVDLLVILCTVIKYFVAANR